jgi:hypothetical protein
MGSFDIYMNDERNNAAVLMVMKEEDPIYLNWVRCEEIVWQSQIVPGWSSPVDSSLEFAGHLVRFI